MNIIELYQALSLDNDKGKISKQVLGQTHWFTINAIFDPRSGEALPQALTPFLKKLEFSKSNDGLLQLHDRLWRITEHVRDAVAHLLCSLNANPKRERALLPIRSVRELDVGSFIKLSQQSGRNIREKLSGKPYLYAVKRYQSVDLPENRLLKAFLARLHELLRARKEYLGRALGEDEDPLLPILDKWLVSDEARCISRWNNLPPNNTLISHRNYRRIWDAWTWLQALDSDIDRDFADVEKRQRTMDFWRSVARYRFSKDTLWAEIPILFDYDKFIIMPWNKQEIFMAYSGAQTFRIAQNTEFPAIPFVEMGATERTIISVPACVDFISTSPTYSTGKSAVRTWEKFIWQNWKNESGACSFVSAEAEATVLGEGIDTILPCMLFRGHKAYHKEMINTAALALAREWRKVFRNDTLIWLVPDALSDFELEVARRSINSVFADAQPLPRSVAAIYEFVDFSKIPHEGVVVTVVDQIDGRQSRTKLRTRFDAKLKKRVPETYGYVWERYPSEVVENETQEGDMNDFHVVSVEGVWRLKGINNQPRKIFRIESESSIHLSNPPVLGGYKVFSLQRLAGEIPLWYDCLPELSTKIPQKGIFDNFYFVKNARVAPKRGVAVDIPINDKFVLSPGLMHYEFPLQRGRGDSSLQFVASLKSPFFPLKSPMRCTLRMTYTYGADNPYMLTFVPEDNSINPIVAEWIPNSRKSVGKLYVPECLFRRCWSDFEHYPRKGNDGFSNLLDWIVSKMEHLDPENEKIRIANKIKRSRVKGTICKIRKTFCFVSVDGEDEDIYCSGSENNIVEDCNLTDFSIGDSVYLRIKRKEETQLKTQLKYGVDLSFYDEVPDALIDKLITKLARDKGTLVRHIHTLRFPVLTAWNCGNSLSDADVPDEFRQKMLTGIKNAERLFLCRDTPKELKDELFFLLCSIHKDSPQVVQEALLNIFSETKELIPTNFRNIAYAIGDASIEWQRELLMHTIKCTDEGKYQSHAFVILSIVLWRNPEVLSVFSFEVLQRLVCLLYCKLEHLLSSGLSRFTIQGGLELLLALIRTRLSCDIGIQSLLAPDSHYSLKFVDLLDTLTKRIVEKNITLETRISFQIDKPIALSRTPDLLYALRTYLTGDSGANTICIASIGDWE